MTGIIPAMLFSEITSLTTPIIDWHLAHPVPNILIDLVMIRVVCNSYGKNAKDPELKGEFHHI